MAREGHVGPKNCRESEWDCPSKFSGRLRLTLVPELEKGLDSGAGIVHSRGGSEAKRDWWALLSWKSGAVTCSELEEKVKNSKAVSVGWAARSPTTHVLWFHEAFLEIVREPS